MIKKIKKNYSLFALVASLIILGVVLYLPGGDTKAHSLSNAKSDMVIFPAFDIFAGTK